MNKHELSAEALNRSMGLSKLDAFAYAVMVGLGEAYFLADGVRLGATAVEFGLLVGLPLAIGAIGPMIALRLLRSLQRRKPVVVGAAALQALMLFVLAWLAGSGHSSIRLLITFSVAYKICAQCAGTAWSSWYGDLVPTAQRGRYFAARNRVAYAGTLIGLLMAGLLLSQFEQARAGAAGAIGGLGFAIAYLIAGLFRCLSVGLLSASSEGTFLGVPTRTNVVRFLRTERGTNAWRLILLIGLLQVAVFVAAPFFNSFMLEDLEFTYIEYMIASAVVVAVKAFVLPLWGRSIDRSGPKRTLFLGGAMLALLPLPWVFADGLYFVLLCEAFSGAAWAGYEVGLFSLLLELGYRRMRPTVFAAQTLVNGSAQLVGSLLGSVLVSAGFGARGVFMLSSGLRVGVVALLIHLMVSRIPKVRRTRPIFRLIGFRPGTGAAQRPVDESETYVAPPAE